MIHDVSRFFSTGSTTTTGECHGGFLKDGGWVWRGTKIEVADVVGMHDEACHQNLPLLAVRGLGKKTAN